MVKSFSLERLLLLGLVLSTSLALVYRGQFIEVYPFYMPGTFLLAIYALRVLYTGRCSRAAAPLSHLVLFFLFLVTLALPFSLDPMRSLSYTLHLYVCLLLFLYMYHNTHVVGTQPIRWALVVLLLAEGGLGLVQVVTGQPLGVVAKYFGESLVFTRGGILGTRRALGTFTNPNVYTQVMALLSAYALASYVALRKVWYLFLSAVGLIALVLAFSRGAWVAAGLLVSTSVLALVRHPSHRRHAIRLLGSVLVSVGTLWFVLQWMGIDPVNVMTRLIERRGGLFYTGDQARIAGIVAGFRLSLDHFFGIGLGAFDRIVPEVGIVRIHSAPFVVLSEVGLLASLVFCLVGAAIAIRVARIRWWIVNDPLILAAWILLPACLFFSLVYLSFMQREVFALYCLFYGAALGLWRRKGDEKRLHVPSQTVIYNQGVGDRG